ncbi:hypothetical protein G3R48_16980, partial [Shewanella intestini]
LNVLTGGLGSVVTLGGKLVVSKAVVMASKAMVATAKDTNKIKALENIAADVTKGVDPARKAIADSAKWRGDQLQKHAWERHPGLAKDGANQLPSAKLYDQRARQNILDADTVVNRKKGDTLYINSQNGLTTGVQPGANGQTYINTFHLRKSNQVPKELSP